MTFASQMAARTEACLAEIALALTVPRFRHDNGEYADRATLLANIRYIKAKAREAELLLRARRSVPPLCGDSSTRAPATSLAGGGGMESALRSIFDGRPR